jgi:copper(I)-binding protein
MNSKCANHRTFVAWSLFVVFAGMSAGRLLGGQTVAVVAHDAWAREPAPSRDVTALFVVLENRGSTRKAVVSATSEMADKVELHEMKMDGTMMRMSPVKQIEVPAGGTTELKPGGLHVMIFGLRRRPAVGDALAVTLTLDDGTKVPVVATVRQEERKQ